MIIPAKYNFRKVAAPVLALVLFGFAIFLGNIEKVELKYKKLIEANHLLNEKIAKQLK